MGRTVTTRRRRPSASGKPQGFSSHKGLPQLCVQTPELGLLSTAWPRDRACPRMWWTHTRRAKPLSRRCVRDRGCSSLVITLAGCCGQPLRAAVRPAQCGKIGAVIVFCLALAAWRPSMPQAFPHQIPLARIKGSFNADIGRLHGWAPESSKPQGFRVSARWGASVPRQAPRLVTSEAAATTQRPDFGDPGPPSTDQICRFSARPIRLVQLTRARFHPTGV